MKKIKLFIDFEIVTILTILILISPFYFLLRHVVVGKNIAETGIVEVLDYQIQIDFEKKTNSNEKLNNDLFKVQIKDCDNNLLYISNSDFEIIAIITIVLAIIVSMFAICIMILVSYIKFIIKSKNKKILSDEEMIDDIKMPIYNVIIANTLYTGRIEFFKLFNFFKQDFEKRNIIDVNGNALINSDINKLDDLEKEFLKLASKEIKYETVKEFKIKVKNELESKKYLETNKTRFYIDLIGSRIEDIGLWILSKDKSDITRIVAETLLPFLILIFIASFKMISVLLILAITYIQLKYYNIFLTKEGKIEKARVTLYLDSLKKKKELTEKEKEFYNALNYINL